MTPDHSALIERMLSKDSALSRFGFEAAPMDSKSQRAEARKAMREAAAALREYRQALRDFNLMRDDGTLPSAPNQAKEAGE